MPQPADAPTPDAAAARARLGDVTRLLAPARLALGDDWPGPLDGGPMPPAEVARLADSTAHLAESLRRRHEEGVLGRARDRLEEAVLAAEARAPVVSGLAHRLL